MNFSVDYLYGWNIGFTNGGTWCLALITLAVWHINNTWKNRF